MKVIRVGLLYWWPDDGIANAICDELQALGYAVIRFLRHEPIPPEADVVFTFAPYGPWLPIARAAACDNRGGRAPVFVHWNTEGMPDLRVPRSLLFELSKLRSSLGLYAHDFQQAVRVPPFARLVSGLRRGAMRYRYVGDYHYAYRQGWLHVLADSSAVYADIHRSRGLPTVVAHWGYAPTWSAELNLERDIDVLWMGKYASNRRKHYLHEARRQLEANGATVYLADNEEHPFIFGDERIQMLNRAKIVMNATRTWYDDNFSRFAIAAPNRAMVVSEHMLDHCPPLRPGEHYAACEPEQLADTILYYLEHQEERQVIAENAYRLFTEELTFRNSIAKIMNEASRALQASK